jgi:hypothetical protein
MPRPPFSGAAVLRKEDPAASASQEFSAFSRRD